MTNAHLLMILSFATPFEPHPEQGFLYGDAQWQIEEFKKLKQLLFDSSPFTITNVLCAQPNLLLYGCCAEDDTEYIVQVKPTFTDIEVVVVDADKAYVDVTEAKAKITNWLKATAPNAYPLYSTLVDGKYQFTKPQPKGFGGFGKKKS
jgi:hypothetical protein